jgi:hypothetical protein
LISLIHHFIKTNYKDNLLHIIESSLKVIRSKMTIAYEQAKEKWFAIVPQLQAKHIIDNRLSSAWIKHLFASVARASVKALNSGDVAPNDLKKFAWLSFSRSIGIVES